MIDGPSEVDHLPVEFHVYLIEMPPPVPNSSHGLHPLASDVRCKHWPEPDPPEPDSLMANVDAALEQQALHVSQRQRESNIHHHDQADDLRRIVEIAERTCWFSGAGHAPLLTVSRGEHQPVHLL